MTERMFNVVDAAAYIQQHGRPCTPSNVKYHYHRSGYLKGQIVGKTLVFAREQLDEFLATAPWRRGFTSESTELGAERRTVYELIGLDGRSALLTDDQAAALLVCERASFRRLSRLDGLSQVDYRRHRQWLEDQGYHVDDRVNFPTEADDAPSH